VRLCLYVSVVLGYTLNSVIRQWTVFVTSVQYCIVSYYYVVCTVMARDVAVAGVSRGPGSLSCTVSVTVAVTVAVVVVFAAVALVIIFFKLVVPSL